MDVVHGVQAFKSMPQPVRSRLAKACQGVHLPAEAVVFKEDDKGDAMYVVVSGSLQVRARPLQASAAVVQPLQEMPAQPLGSASGGGGSDAAAAHNGPGTQEGSIPGGAGARQMRATADAVCAGPSGSGDGSSGVRGQLKGSRRTTWEGAAFTAKEQGRLDAVRTALQAERLQVSVQVLQTPHLGMFALTLGRCLTAWHVVLNSAAETDSSNRGSAARHPYLVLAAQQSSSLVHVDAPTMSTMSTMYMCHPV